MKKALGCFGWMMVAMFGIALLVVAAPLALVVSIFAWWHFNKKDNEKYTNIAKLSTVVSALGTVFFIYAINTPTVQEEWAESDKEHSIVERVESEPEALEEVEAESELEVEKIVDKPEETEEVNKPEVETKEESSEVNEPAEEVEESEELRPEDYNPDITYEDLARNPDSHIFKPITFEGKIVQVIQGEESSQYRLAANGNYDNMFLIEISNDKLEQRILEDDYIRFYGYSMGEITYESALGGNITVPGVLVNEFEFK